MGGVALECGLSETVAGAAVREEEEAQRSSTADVEDALGDGYTSGCAETTPIESERSW